MWPLSFIDCHVIQTNGIEEQKMRCLSVTHLRVEKPFRRIYNNFNIQYIWTEMKCLLTYDGIVGKQTQLNNEFE